MKTFLFTLLTGIVCGVIDILPMIKMKLNRFSIISAFVFYIIVPFVIYNSSLFSHYWFIKGGLLTLMLALPVIILVAGEGGVLSAVPIIIMSLVLGTAIGAAGHFLFKVM